MINEDMTLDPPGTIAIVGAGPIGIEAALYGRFLGYDVTLWEAESVGSSLLKSVDAPLPMLPDRCLSPLAVAALEAQSGGTESFTLPLTYGEWVQRALIPLTKSDLLAGRLHQPAKVVRIDQVPVTHDDDDESAIEAEPVPEDFRLHLESGETIDVEAVVLAIGDASLMELAFPEREPYFFRLGHAFSGDDEADLRSARSEIVTLFAQLAGRPDLDLYRPRRG